VLDSSVTDANFKIVGKKTYKSSIKFRWGIAILLFFVGAFLGAYSDTISNQNGNAPEDDLIGVLMILLPLAIYVIYYFVKKKGSTSVGRGNRREGFGNRERTKI